MSQSQKQIFKKDNRDLYQYAKFIAVKIHRANESLKFLIFVMRYKKYASAMQKMF